MKRMAYILDSIVFICLVFLTPAYTFAAPNTKETDRLYGTATLLPMFGLSNPPRGGPHGTALFYKVGDAANSTRVVIQLENMEPGDQLTPGITMGDCQGNGLATLTSLTIDQSGRGQSTTVLTGRQVSFGQWYVHVYFCDMLNPGQICSVCGKVDQITPRPAGSVPGGESARGNLPATGSSFASFLMISLVLALGLLLLASGTYLRLSDTHRGPHD